jgi:hypothetical protein
MDDKHRKDLYYTVFTIEYELARANFDYADAVVRADAAACYAVSKFKDSFPY